MFGSLMMAGAPPVLAPATTSAGSSGSTAGAATTEGPAVTEVLVFDVGQNMDKFMQLSKRANSIAEKYGGSGKARLWVAQYAGRDAGSVIVTVEYPNFTSMAQAVSRTQSSPEWRQLIADAQASSIKPISRSVVLEVTASP